jgi:hypothetical protein
VLYLCFSVFIPLPKPVRVNVSPVLSTSLQSKTALSRRLSLMALKEDILKKVWNIIEVFMNVGRYWVLVDLMIANFHEYI